MEEKEIAKSVRENSLSGEFLQSNEWLRFQESVGRKTFHLSGENFWANIIEHKLPIAGKYFYVPRGPILKISNLKFQISNQDQISNVQISKEIQELVALAKKNSAGWIRIDPETEEILAEIKKWTSNVHNGHLMSRNISIARAPHDMQPKEIFVINITKSEEELLAEMKAKTRYNIKLSQKHNVLVKVISNDKIQTSNQIQISNDQIEVRKYVDEFLRLTAVMAKRQGIVAHPGSYYRKMLEIIPGDILKLYVAEFDGRVIATNLVVFYGGTCTYLHGASDDDSRSVMAPYLLQWQQICDAKKAGCVRYNFGGVKNPPHPNPLLSKERGQNAENSPSPYQGEGGRRPDEVNSWSGITKFKLGFSPKTLPTIFPGSYDIIINSKKYWIYRTLQKLKGIF
jgi:lipid II:glycine glycyltransferase (peptidoglycan interpeptide bridge formation enzyme)